MSICVTGSRGFALTVGRPSFLKGAMFSMTCGCSLKTLSATARQAVEQVDEPVLTVDEVSRRYNVSSRTVTRWRRQGLVARRFVIGGRTKVGFPRVEPAAICHGPSRAGRTGLTVSATD